MCKVGYYSTLEVVGYPVQSSHVPFHHLMLRVHMYVILSCMYRILCRRLTEYLLVMSERALETVIGAFTVTRSAEDISDGYRITLPWILMHSSWKRLYPRGADYVEKEGCCFFSVQTPTTTRRRGCENVDSCSYVPNALSMYACRVPWTAVSLTVRPV